MTEFTLREKNHIFVESAIFADDAKKASWWLFDKWHFYPKPFTLPPKQNEEEYHLTELQKKIEEQNSVYIINEAKDTLKHIFDAKKEKNVITDFLSKSFSLRFLIHLIGDIHQPLHDGSLFSKDFEKEDPKTKIITYGDRGGNNFKIKVKGRDTNLHAFWDSTLGIYDPLDGPFDEKDWTKLTTICDDLVNLYPRESFVEELTKKNPIQWQEEGYEIAKTKAYEGLTPNCELPEDYVANNTEIVKKQLVLGGYRLADTLLELFIDKKGLVTEEYLKEHVAEEKEIKRAQDINKENVKKVDDFIIKKDVRDVNSIIKKESLKNETEETPKMDEVLKKLDDRFKILNDQFKNIDKNHLKII